MLLLHRPTTATINAFLARQADKHFTYSEIGASQLAQLPDGYIIDKNRICLGQGHQIYLNACAALQKWVMFANGWTLLGWNTTPIKQGEIVAVIARVFGVWWCNANRIVYVIDDTTEVQRYGFAYGTLPDHAECGEEFFLISWQPLDDTVWFEITAFSRPRHWLTKLGYPLARRLQKKFANDAMHAMKNAVTTSALNA